jgi:hypothetical protein
LTIKEELLSLLERDREFRYAVAGLLSLEEALRRLDEHGERLVRIEEELVRLRGEMAELREDMVAGFKRHDEEMAKLREEMYAGFKRHDEEMAKLREEMYAGFKRYDEAIVKLREDMVAGFKRHDEEMAKLREEMYAGFKRYDEAIVKLREDMNKGFELVNRHISALGARWGMMAEEAFREGLRGLLERELGLRVERWIGFDEEGLVYGYPKEVEVDVAVKDEKIILIEVSSHARGSDVSELKRKAELYQRRTRRKPDRLIIVTPYADERALEASKRLEVEIYTSV